MRTRAIQLILLLPTLFLSVVACHREQSVLSRKSGFEEFLPIYNQYIKNWLLEQKTTSTKELETLTTQLEAASPEQRAVIEAKIRAISHELTKWQFRLSLGDYLKRGNVSEIPADLTWETGQSEPEIGDLHATKGGIFRQYIPTFPPTLRPVGENSNNFFRGYLYDNIDMALIALHPATMKLMPALADRWAISSDGRTVYMHIDPSATYSDGVPVKAEDFLFSVYLRASDNIVNPSGKQYYRETIAQIAIYDNATLSVSLPDVMPYAAAIAGRADPSPSHFYQDYGPDYTTRYQWLFPPTTGAYEVEPEGVVKGASITQSRVKNWWARDRKFYKCRFNPDKIVYTVVRNEAKAFSLFQAGELDTAILTRPYLWYEKSEIPQVYNGYVERVKFYNQYPKVPWGLYLNCSKAPLNDKNVRLGINYAMNWEKVINVLFRGDYQRLNAFNESYLNYSDPTIRARSFSISNARDSFRAAGYDQEGKDGILKKADGTRLSVAISYGADPQRDRMFSILREDAKACGLDLRLDGDEPTVNYKKAMQKQHEISFSGWGVTPPVPEFRQFLHSTTAFDDKGNPKPQTNNLFVWGRADTDALCEQADHARTDAELREATQKLQHIIHEEGIFVPGFAVDFVRLGYWRWVRWPDSETTKFSPPIVYDPHDSFVLWVDEHMKEETQAARRSKKTFPESTRVWSDYRLQLAKPQLPREEQDAGSPSTLQPE